MQTWGDIRMRPTSMWLFDSICIHDCSLILFVQVELKKCAFRSRSQFTIACHNPGNLQNCTVIISIAHCINGVPAVSVSVRINVSNMLEIRVLSASARQRGLWMRIRHHNYRIHIMAERQHELCRHARHMARILRGLKFETLEDFVILWHLRHVLEDITPMSALFMHWRGKVSHLWCKKRAMWIQDTLTAVMRMKIWSSGQVRCQSKWVCKSIIWQSGVASLMWVPRPRPN